MMKHRFRIFEVFLTVVLLLLLLNLPRVAYSATLLVPSQYTTIQGAIDAAVTGDTVQVANGIYNEANIDFGGKEITVVSENGPENTIIDASSFSGERRVFNFHSGEPNTSILEGFTIMGGYSEFGAGVECSNNSSPTIRNCIIRDNNARFGYWGQGGGIACFQSSPIITNCTIIRNNTEWYGGGICIFQGSSPRISNCIINGNNAILGGGIYCYANSNATITNCTIIGNTVPTPYWGPPEGGGIYCNTNSTPTVTNCIIWRNSGEDICGTATVTYSNVGGGYGSPLDYNIDVDPALLNVPELWDITISPYQGTINTIHVEDASLYSTGDILEINGDSVERTVTAKNILTNTIEFTPAFTNPEWCYLLVENWGLNTNLSEDFHLQATSPCIDLGTLTDAPATDIDGELRPQCGGIDIGGDETTACIVYVDGTNPSAGDGTQTNPYREIQPAINAAADGNIVLVADGTYKGTGNIDIYFSGKAITLRSQNGPNATTIDCEDNPDHRCFHFHHGETNASLVDGFTITGGYAIGSGAWDVLGGGILCENSSSPTINNCIITGNTAACTGAAIYCDQSSPVITNCVISNNIVPSTSCPMAAIHLTNSDTIITNCLIASNVRWAIWCSNSNLVVSNCTLYDNSDGIIGYAPNPIEITNSILWNINTEIGTGTNADVTYSNIEGSYPGLGNINADPLFFDPTNNDFSLSQIAAGQTVDSPCVDWGDPATSQSVLDIINGKTTRTDCVADIGIVDMGYHYGTFALNIRKNGSGTGTITGAGIGCGTDCSEQYNDRLNVSVSLIATPDPGSDFTGWSGGGCSTGDCVTTINKNTTITATFAINNVDTDNDGLLDWIEYLGCTNLNHPDTDNDGLDDGVEDANHDGKTLGWETDPCNPDTDGDGMDDGWEINNGLNATVAYDAYQDTDGDGFINYIEYLADTDPRNQGQTPSPGQYNQYDILGRLIKTLELSGTQIDYEIEYEYDSVGNRTVKIVK